MITTLKLEFNGLRIACPAASVDKARKFDEMPEASEADDSMKAERCKEMICIAPSCWTPEKLKYFADVEKKLYEAWLNGMVYGYIIEKWDEKRREWMQTSSLWGMYGAEELMLNLAEETDGVSIPICLDDEDMKYDFDNTEKKVNEFDGSTPVA